MRTMICAILLIAVCTPAAFAREWTDSTGKYKIEAEFIDHRDGTVRLKKADDSIITLSIDELSEVDRRWVLAHAAAVPKGSVTPKAAWQTTDRLLLGTVQGQRVNGRFVVDDATFGVPESWCSSKAGTAFLLVEVAVEARRDNQWVEDITAVHLKDGDGKEHKFDLWLFNGAYRDRFFLDLSKDQGIAAFKSTTLAFGLPTPLPKGLTLMSGSRELAAVAGLVAATACSGKPIPGYSLDQKTQVYCLADGVAVQPKPEFDNSKKDLPRLAFGEEATTTGETSGNWVQMTCAGRDVSGWVHRAALTLDRPLIERAEKIGAKPRALVCLSNIQDVGTFNVSILSGGLRLGTKRLLADHGMCVVVGHEKLATVKQGVSMKGFGVEQTLEYPEPWTPYFYCSAERTFRPLASLIADGKVVTAGSPLPKEEAVIGAAEQKKVTRSPGLSGAVSGANPVRVRNPNSYSVKVALRSGTDGKDFSVAANDTTTVHVRDGRYDIYFQYSDDPEGLYQGDSFTLSGNGVEIQLVKVVGGNYGIRKIK